MHIRAYENNLSVCKHTPYCCTNLKTLYQLATAGNYNTFPRIQSLVNVFNSSGAPVRPYWLTPAQLKLNASGLLDEVDAWATASEQLYVQCWKIDVEDQRRNVMMSGYEWWLVTDYCKRPPVCLESMICVRGYVFSRC